MKSKRMTLEELTELKPSLGNPIKLVCDDGYFTNSLRKITVIGVKGSRINYINNSGFANNCEEDLLENYPSFKEEDKFVEFFEHVDKFGSIKFLTIDKLDEYDVDNSENVSGCDEYNLTKRKIIQIKFNYR